MTKNRFMILLQVSMFMLLLKPFPALAESYFRIEAVALSKSITNRNPVGAFSPPAYCEKDKNGQAAIPVVEMSQTSTVTFWTKVAATTQGALRHSWHHQIAGTWTMVSEVHLSIRPSPGYRTWSKKSLKPALHSGEWMIVVAPAKEPERILCIARFTVQ